MEIEASGNGAMSEYRRAKDEDKGPSNTRRNTEKNPKLPSISSTKEVEPKENNKKIALPKANN